MDHCGTNQVFDAVDRCSTTNLKTNETLLNFMAPSRKREEPNSELSPGLMLLPGFGRPAFAMPGIGMPFFPIKQPDITAEVCSADANLFRPVEEENRKASIKKGNKNKDGKDGMHFRDVRKRPWGRYAAEIRDPSETIGEWLRTVDTEEEAARSYDAAARGFRGAKAKLNFPPAEEEIGNPETKKKGNRNPSPSASNTAIPVESLSREGLEEELGMDPEDTGVISDWLRRYSRKGSEELGMDPENRSIISDLLRFVIEKEIYKKAGKAWKRLYLFCNTPDSKSLIDAMANYLEFGIYVLDPTDLLLSWSELRMTNMLASIPNRSLIRIPDFDHRLCDFNTVEELEGSCLLEFVHGLVSHCGDEQIIVFATDNRDLHDAALQHPFNEYVYIHKSSPWPDEGDIVKEGENVDEGEIVKEGENVDEGVIVDGGEIVQFDIIKQKPLVDVDLNFPPVEEKIRNPEIKKKGDCNQSPSASASSTVTHVKSSSWKGFEELGMDPENTGIISDLKRFKVGKELFKLFGKSLTRFYLLYDPPGADRSSLIAAMADFLEYRIHNLDVTSFSSLSELRNMLASITNRSLIWIQDSDQWIGK
ncbi:hypothetical protein RHGRI_038729 [Rhododendron griersonianum]|uniref:AP2/ERF domain-containing protein n=1 Tax=Rhododendron griersonianum TaxID=479676 RepID=A0AAV6HLJ5_9ERIC|nr:hypothetical protein RHGRI_038729 [Rhododendron griersonianum]